MNPIIGDLIRSINVREFIRILDEAYKCSEQRNKTLTFEIANYRKDIRCDFDKTMISIYLQPGATTSELEHHAAHELCHVIASCCGFTHSVSFPKQLENQLAVDREYEVLDALLMMQRYLGSFLTHVAVHSLLKAAGYDDPNWDDFLVMEAQNTTEIEAILGNRVANVGWAIQYDVLDKYSLPGLNIQDLKTQLRRLLPTFEDDYHRVRSGTNIADLTDIDGCLASTMSLARALVGLIGYPGRDIFTIDVACRPTHERNFHQVMNRLSRLGE